MKIKINGKRRLRKIIRCITAPFKALTAWPPVKPAAAIVVSLGLLLLLAPYLLTRITPQTDLPSHDQESDSTFQPIDPPKTIRLYLTETKKTVTLPFEDYVKGVVSGEMPASFHPEALKAQAVAARTYSVGRILRGEKEGNPSQHMSAPLCDSTHCQVYRSEQELLQLKSDAWMKDGWIKICAAVDSTEGKLLYYNGRLVEQALFHSSSGGQTENSEDVFAVAVPYLISVDSPYEAEATHQNEENGFTLQEISSALKSKYPSIQFGGITTNTLKIISRSEGGRVERMRIGSASLTGRQVREALGLPSANFSIDIRDGSIVFTSSGSGHGVGMSQYGANGMAEKGYDYKAILNHYYKGTQVY